MKRALKRIKVVLVALLSLVSLLVLAVLGFLTWAPQIGQVPQGEDLHRVSQSPHWKGGRFVNLIPTSTASLSDLWSTLGDYINAENTAPDDSLPVSFALIEGQHDSLSYITWYGHSAFLIELNQSKILIDPMLGDYAAPLSFGSKRFPYKEAIPIENLKDIDAVIISHDHYDHLDYPTIKKIQGEVKHWYTALGVGSHLKRWGIAAEQITELDWWQEASLGELRFAACPARHFSGRSLFNQNSSQWASWYILGADKKLYFSGDGGYGPHFKAIYARYGSPDFAMLECGQYNKAWADIHMMPEQSVQAGEDLNAHLIMPIHWGAFSLAMHEWLDPIERFKLEAQRRGIPLAHPMIGERFALESLPEFKEWWLKKKPD